MCVAVLGAQGLTGQGQSWAMKPKDGPTITGGQSIRNKKLVRARQFRREPTPAESRAWEILRDRRLLGLKFRRQQVIDGFIVDFYCPRLRLVIEVDGAVHDHPETRQYDTERTRHLESKGITVIRVRNEEVSIPKLTTLLTQRLSSE
jgi:very-short-patch-repair endonuclease